MAIDMSPLEKSHDDETDHERKAILRLALDLLGSGYITYFVKVFKNGRHHEMMSPRGALGFEKVIQQFIQAEEELEEAMGKGKAKEKENDAVRRVIVCRLPAPAKQDVKGKGKAKAVVRPCISQFSRRTRGKSVKLCEPRDEVKDEVLKRVKVKDEPNELVVGDEEMFDGEVQIINKRLFHYLVQRVEEEKDMHAQCSMTFG